MWQKPFVDSQHQRICFHVLSAPVKLSSNLPENQRSLPHTCCDINSFSLSLSLNNTDTHAHFILKEEKNVCDSRALQRHTIEQSELHSASYTSPSLTDATVVANAMGQRREVAKLKDTAIDLKEQDEKEMKIPMIPLPSYLVVTI